MVERYLAPHEAAISAADVRVVLCSELVGVLDEQALADALTHLADCYPLTLGHITGIDGRPLVRLATESTPGPTLNLGTDLRQEINAHHTWTTGPLLRTTLVREPERVSLVMTLPRAFVDGMSYLALHSRFWTIYTALRTGRPIPGPPDVPALAPALDDLLAARFTATELHDFVQQRKHQDSTDTPAVLAPLASQQGAPGPDATFRIIRRQQSPTDTAAFTALARASALTVNQLASGVLLTSLRPQLEPPTGPARILCTTAVDMRRRLEPPIPRDVLQSAATTTSVRLDVDTDATPIDVGRDIANTVRAQLDSGAAAMELAAFGHIINQQLPSLVITNVGTIPEPDLPDGLRISAVRIAPLGHLPTLFAVVSRYQDSLVIDLSYSKTWYTDTQIHTLADHTTSVIDDLIT